MSFKFYVNNNNNNLILSISVIVLYYDYISIELNTIEKKYVLMKNKIKK